VTPAAGSASGSRAWTPHTDDEVAGMLADLGLASVEALFDVVPAALRLATGLDLAPGASEFDVADRLGELAAANRAADLVCFAGAGAYDHDIPAVVRRVGLRAEFVTAYTPYQPEVAQGVLQALFEYQTLVSRLTGLGVANASLYDGATACVEAVNLAVAATGRSTVWVSAGLHPAWRQVLATFAAGTGHELRTAPLSDGTTAWPAEGEPGAVVVAYPNHLGCLEDVGAVVADARARGALVVVAVDPVAAGLLRTAGDWGADVAVGEGQPLGTPLSFGGPYLGLFATTGEHVRRLPGRLVGQTVDAEGRRAYVTTLRTREQDIRRERASSNVCTNQTLVAVAFAIQLAWLGTAGLRELALRCARATRYLRDQVAAVAGVEPLVSAPVLRELALRLPVAADTALERMAEEGFLAGVSLAGEGEDRGLLVAATERRTRAEIDAYAQALARVLK